MTHLSREIRVLFDLTPPIVAPSLGARLGAAWGLLECDDH